MAGVSYTAPSVRNITRVFRGASQVEIATGIEWYTQAHRIAVELSTRYDVELDAVCGIIAALSPLNSWGNNVNLANRFLAAGGLHSGYLSAGLSKARRILAGEDPEIVLSGAKILNFYRSIRSAGVEGVCVDRHAYSLAVNDRSVSNNVPKLTPGRYEAVVDCYTRAARILSCEYGMPLTPAQVQSVTWQLWRRRYWSDGAFDQYTLEVS